MKTSTFVILLVIVVIGVFFSVRAYAKSKAARDYQYSIDNRDYASVYESFPTGNPHATKSGGLGGKCDAAYEKLRATPGLAEAGSAKTGVPPEQLRAANQISQKIFCTPLKVVDKVWSGIKSIF